MNCVRLRMPTSTAATVTSASSPAREAADLDRQRQRLARPGRLPARRCATSSLRAASSMLNQARPMARPGMRFCFDVERAMGQRDRIGARAPVGADLEAARRCRPPARSTSMNFSILSPTSAIVALPVGLARRCAASRSRRRRKLVLSSVTTTLSGVSALAEPPQPTSKVMLVSSPSADLMSSRWRPQLTWREILAGVVGVDVDAFRSASALRRLHRLVVPAAVGIDTTGSRC